MPHGSDKLQQALKVSGGAAARQRRHLWCKKAARVQKVPAGLFCLCVRAGSLVRALG